MLFALSAAHRWLPSTLTKLTPKLAASLKCNCFLYKSSSIASQLQKQEEKIKMKLVFDPRLKGIKELDEAAKRLFDLHIDLPAIKVRKSDYTEARKLLRDHAFDSVNHYKKYQDLPSEDRLSTTHKYILLDADTFRLDALDESFKSQLVALLSRDEERKRGGELSSYVDKLEISVGYEDVKFEDVIRAIIPDDLLNENVNIKGYSIVGHVAHFNLRDKVLAYKHLIGQALLDKMSPQLKTVVNKVNGIDNTYRNFTLEILAGVDNTCVETRENSCTFRFDFAKVYWNPRLGTEHERVVKLLHERDVLYDVFAGVGPFSVPGVTVRKVSAVLANDLNPDSYRCLVENHRINNKSKTKLKEQQSRAAFLKSTSKSAEAILAAASDGFSYDPLQTFFAFNMDGKEFIKSKLKYHLIETLNYREVNKIGSDDDDDASKAKFYVLMNLPAIAIEFLHAFRHLYNSDETRLIEQRLGNTSRLDTCKLHVYCYHFAKSEQDDLLAVQARIRSAEVLGDEQLAIESKFVRKVAPNKDMYCSMFELTYRRHLSSTVVAEETNGTITTTTSNNKTKSEHDHSAEEGAPNKMLKTE